MEKETGFLKAMDAYGDRPRFMFWDNQDDFYEVMHQADLVVYDYSSIVSDFVAAGVPHYIRYVFDFDEYRSTVMLHDNYFEKTTGQMCYTFDELLDAMDTFQQRDEAAEVADLNQRLWSYSQGKDDFERIIKAAFDFCVEDRQRPTLYSFDIFDTLISRKCLDPAGIFYYVREKIIADGSFPISLREKYPSIRHTAEFNMREYYNKTKVMRQSDAVEVHFDEIFDRIANVYNLSQEQVEKLKAWELEAELDNYELPPKCGLLRKKQPVPESSLLTWMQEKQGSCFVCNQMQENMQRYFDTFFAMLKDGEFREKVEHSKGFCMHHFRVLVEESANSLPNSQREWFQKAIPALMQENLHRVKADLDRFVMKNDYRNAALPWENAMDAVCRGMQKLQGGHPADPVFRNSDFGIRK